MDGIPATKMLPSVNGPALLACCLLCTPAIACALERPSPPLMLANVYDAEIDLSQYWASEKYDGVRAYWDGRRLLTRSGHFIHAPDWFIAGWPGVALDGELWVARGQFEAVIRTVRDEHPDESAWRRIRFMVFDLPAHPGVFTQRCAALKTLLATLASSRIQLVSQFKVADQFALQAKLEQIMASGGEGLMLHRADSFYRAERNDDLLKVKSHQDAEAQVIGHLPGNGKYRGMLGALLVQRPDGLQFRIGTGFTDEQRRRPPPLGSWLTYSYHGFTARGVPRFARFVRLREDAPAATLHEPR